ncbi:glycoside hydrolase [Piromyces finnis]|uniref:Glycoside hydrolase n=1 Tax=Piromyces finnis TaxID=1754191 RepID=A0A1Y1VGN1_9FUNG|nr:glycoside hydrolase [Piromyces finnis]|eukprot:ORX55233.1 glycoside hydrolase [Piromyces finnis]
MNIFFLNLVYSLTLLYLSNDIYSFWGKNIVNNNGINEVWAVPIENTILNKNQQIISLSDNQHPTEVVMDDIQKTDGLEEENDYKEDYDEILFDTSNPCSKNIIAYYTEWRAAEILPSQLPYDKLTHINYAFGVIDSKSFEVVGYNSRILSNVITYAHQQNVKVLLSVGGWSGSEYFTKMTSTEENMDAFVESVRSTIFNLELDGIDIDWEYPGRYSNNNNPDYANDTPNYLILLKKLRSALGDSILITAAVSITPFEKNGRVLNDLSEFAEYFDFVNIMAYDFSGSWSSIISHHESFEKPEKGHDFSFKSSVENWVQRGFPPEKLVIGVGAYGRSWISNTKMNLGLFQTFDNTVYDREDDYHPKWFNYCQQDKLDHSSTWRYKYIYKYILSLREDRGEREENDDPFNYSLHESNGIIQYDCWLRVWDSIAQAPYLFNTKFNNFISYDDPQSLKIKMNYIQENGYAGVMMWELDGDNDDWILINTMNNCLCH